MRTARRTRNNRNGAVLVAAIVVLFIVCMLAVQTTKTLSTIRYGAQRRSSLRQAQELVELGKLVIASRAGKEESPPKFTVEFDEDKRGSIEIAFDPNKPKANIKVEYTRGTSPAIEASWEGKYE